MGGWKVWPSEASPGASCCGTSDQDVATQNRVCCSAAWAEAHKALCSSPTAACWAIWVEWQELSYLGNAESVYVSQTFVGNRGGGGGFQRLVMEMNLISYLLSLCNYCSAGVPAFTHFALDLCMLTSEYEYGMSYNIALVWVLTGMSYHSKIYLNVFFSPIKTQMSQATYESNIWMTDSRVGILISPILTDTS